MRIIGLTGKARSGKDTAAGFILDWAEKEGVHCKRQGFADLLKLSAFRALGGSPELPISTAVKFCDEFKQEGGDLEITLPAMPLDPIRSYAITGREFLQRYGTEAHRNVFGTDFWVDALFDYVNADDYDLLVIPDCRFDNEATAIVDRGGEVWEVERPGAGVKGGLEHTSEAGVSEGFVDFAIANVGDLDDLRAMVCSLCENEIEGVA